MLPLVYLLPLIILVEGFVSIAIEILTIRQLLPVVGGSVVVTSLIIGIFLLFLALGYERGGQINKNLTETLQRNFIKVGLIAGVGLSYFFIEFFFQAARIHPDNNLLIPLLAYLAVILAPMIYFLGQTIPITINLARENNNAGKLAGRTLGISTLGSFLGAILTTLVLMHFLGVAWTIFIVFALLMLLAICLTQKVTMMKTCCKAGAMALIVFLLNVTSEHALFRATTNFANYRIADSTNSELPVNAHMLDINDTPSSYHDVNRKPFEYIQLIQKYLFTDLKLKNAEILVLGAGGYTLSENNSNHNHFTYVDIDNRLHQVIKPEFSKAPNDDLVINDARSFINTSNKQYDVIVVDVYGDSKAIPAYLITKEFMLGIADHLPNKGYAVFNVIANPTFADNYSKRIDNTIRAAFGNCMATPIHFSTSQANIIYVCSKQMNAGDKTVYVDNKNNSTLDAFLQ